MAVSQAAKKVDDALGGIKDGIDTTPLSNPSKDPNQAGSQKMQALAWMGKNTVQIVETDTPKIIDPHDVIVKVTGSTVCGSDMHLLHGVIVELEKGDILGHEFMGEVIEVGSAVTKVKVGDRAVASFNIGCGDCWSCRQGLSSTCTRTNTSKLQNAFYGNRTCGMFGYSHFTGGFAGGQCEYARVPHGDANLLKIPSSVADEDALYLSDILVTSYNQVTDSGVKKGDWVGIWGAGAIGIMCAKWSLLKGADRVIVIDKVQWRLDHIKSKMPQVEIVNFLEKKDVVGTINEMTKPGTSKNDPDGTRPAGLDVALECAAGEYPKGWLHTIELALGLETDTSELVNECIASVRPWGTVGVTGVYAAFCNHFNIGAVMEKGVRFIGNGQAPVHKYWKEVLDDYLIPGKIDCTDLFVSHRITLEDVPKCYHLMDSKKEPHIIKPFVQTRFSSPSRKGMPLTTL